jgi:hypothetical protein
MARWSANATRFRLRTNVEFAGEDRKVPWLTYMGMGKDGAQIVAASQYVDQRDCGPNAAELAVGQTVPACEKIR